MMCLSVCLSVGICPELHIQSLLIFMHATCGGGSVLLFGDEAGYVHASEPILWMTSYLHIIARNEPHKKAYAQSDSPGGTMTAKTGFGSRAGDRV